MKQLLLFVLAVISSSVLMAQTTIFNEDFESGTNNWTLEGTWGLTTSTSHSASNSLSESPNGNYDNNISINATMTNGLDLSNSLSADISFWAKYDIEKGFDYMYLEVSPDGGSTWNNIATYDDTLSIWTQFNYSLGGYVGNSNVKIRYRFVSDGGLNLDGMYIDDIIITSDSVDNAAPLVIHTPSVLYEGTIGANTLTADIIDISGISTAALNYSIDGGTYNSINATSINGDNYSFVVPYIPAGALITYYFYAADSAIPNNNITTDTFSYITGNYIYYDNGDVNFVDSISSSSAAAVLISLPTGTQQLTSVLIRNYTDIGRPNDSMQVHIWTNNGGIPGTDIITPKTVFPAATLDNTSGMTIIDLRSDSTLLNSLTGDVFIGYTVPSGGVWTPITEPGTGNRSFIKGDSGWVAALGSNGIIDFHFRAITTPNNYTPPAAPVASFSFVDTSDPTVVFTDLTTNSPTTWFWNFDDNGNTSTDQNPTHTYPAVGGTYNVCLTATNNGGSSTPYCQNIVLSVGAGIDPAFGFENISIFPNPMIDKSTINFDNINYNKIEVKVYDIHGRRVNINYINHKNSIEILRSGLSHGLYVIDIWIDNIPTYNAKLIIR